MVRLLVDVVVDLVCEPWPPVVNVVLPVSDVGKPGTVAVVFVDLVSLGTLVTGGGTPTVTVVGSGLPGPGTVTVVGSGRPGTVTVGPGPGTVTGGWGCPGWLTVTVTVQYRSPLPHCPGFVG